MGNENMLEIKQLNKSFKKKQILKEINFSVNKGECLAIIGPNGTGKSVLISCLLGEYPLTEGEIKIKGKMLNAKALKNVSVLLQETFVEKRLKVSELITIERYLASTPLTLKEIHALLQFSDKELNQFAENLSGGKKRFLSFILLLIKQPDIIFLDEPTTGMDTSTRIYFWKIIEELKQKGKTIIYTTHYIEEVEETANRILILHKGAIIKDTTPYLLKQEGKEKIFTLPLIYLSLFDEEKLPQLEKKHDCFSFISDKPEETWKDLMAKDVLISDIEMTNHSLLDHIFLTERELEND